jgi:phosphatidylserine decarboxylase
MAAERGTYKTVAISEKDNLSVSFLYNTPPGRLILRLLVKPAVSKIFGRLANSRLSRIFIKKFIRKNNIDMGEYLNTGGKYKYKSFNDFFIREIKKECRPLPEDMRAVFAPCDGKLTAYPITDQTETKTDAGVFKIKNSLYTVGSLLADKELAKEFEGGVCLIFRLMPDDYHRYYYIAGGEILSHRKIKGRLHTVRAVALKRYNIYAQNSREYITAQTKKFGKIIQMEVGALFVGRVSNHKTEGAFSRGEEKGMFEFGGSTVVMLFQKDKIKIDAIIFENTKNNKETIVKLGDKIGEGSQSE